MKAQPLKKTEKGYTICSPNVATHVQLNFPSPSGIIILPIMLSGTRKGTNNWTWNGDVDKPTLKPSILTRRGVGSKCHSFVTDGKVKFLMDSNHEFAGMTVDMLEVSE